MNNIVSNKQKDDYNKELKKLKEIKRIPFDKSVRVDLDLSSSKSSEYIFKRKLYKTPFDIKKVNVNKKKKNQSYQNINKLINSYNSISDLSKDSINESVLFKDTSSQFMLTGLKYQQANNNNNHNKHKKHFVKSLSASNLYQTDILPYV